MIIIYSMVENGRFFIVILKYNPIFLKRHMRKKIIKISVCLSVVALATIGVKMANSEQISSMGLVFSNMEALASGESTSKEYDCYSIFEGEGTSISCATCKETSGTPPWYHFGSKCTRY